MAPSCSCIMYVPIKHVSSPFLNIWASACMCSDSNKSRAIHVVIELRSPPSLCKRWIALHELHFVHNAWITRCPWWNYDTVGWRSPPFLCKRLHQRQCEQAQALLLHFKVCVHAFLARISCTRAWITLCPEWNYDNDTMTITFAVIVIIYYCLSEIILVIMPASLASTLSGKVGVRT